MELSGKIIAALDPVGGVSKSSGNSWKCQSFVLETHDQYPKKMCFDVFGEDKIQQFAIKPGEELTVSFDIDAREWNGKWFNSIRAWKIERVGGQQPQQVQQPQGQMPTAPNLTPQNNDDDLPF